MRRDQTSRVRASCDQASRDQASDVAVLAVDGGNSKTDLALVAADGSVVAAVRGPGSSHQRLGLDGAIRALREGIAALRAAAGTALPGTSTGGGGLARLGVFCLAGLDLPVDHRRIGAALRGERLAEDVVLHNDTRAVLWAGSPLRWGVAVGAGTGLNCVGVAPDGREARFPSLGLISGDWVAGGRWLGVRALGQAVRARDGRGPRTALEHAVPAYYGLPDPLAVAEAVYVGQIEQRQLLQLAPTVFETAAGGDPVARSLLDELAREVVTYIAAAVRRLELAALEVPVVLGGGLFRAGDAGFLDRVHRGVRAVAPQAQIRVLDAPPVLGAALLGLAALGARPGAGTDGAGPGAGTGGADGELRLAAALTHARFDPPALPPPPQPAPAQRAEPVSEPVRLPAGEAS